MSKVEHKLNLIISGDAADALEWLREKTDAEDVAAVIRNALRLHYVLLQAQEEGTKFSVRNKDGAVKIIDMFVRNGVP